MNSHPRLTIALVFVSGLLLGGLGGGLLGFRRARDMVVDNWVNTNARNGTAVAQALRQLRTNQNAEGMDKLETHLNRLLVGLTPSYIDGFDLSEGTLAQLQRTRDSARSYRLAYPRPAGQQLLDREVAQFLGTVDSARK
jgi:hypothetical protein